jgi:predicted nucleotidyltransferase
MKSRTRPPDEWQYGSRSSAEVRGTLLELTRDFVLSARRTDRVHRIAVLGSLLTDKARPKDADVLVTIPADSELTQLARLGRRLKGSAQARLNSGADIFLADPSGRYLGRVCHYRECHPRVLCRARHCGAVPHLADDLDLVDLPRDLILAPPLELFPHVVARVELPDDVERLLVAPFRSLGMGTQSAL